MGSLTELKPVFDIAYPLQIQNKVVHFKDVKCRLMQEFGLNRWELDEHILRLHQEYFDGQTFPFYLGTCGWHPGSRLNFISRAKKGEIPTRSNSYCFISFDVRNLFVQEILEGGG